jgi:uncharacterized protein YodC (DUF2158 family)
MLESGRRAVNGTGNRRAVFGEEEMRPGVDDQLEVG